MTLLRAVREACRPGLWSQGVALAQEGAVVVQSATPAEVTARVRSPGAAIAPTGVLYLEDEEWSCDGGGKVAPCAHVAATAIAHAQNEKAGAPRPPEKRMSHQLSRLDGTLYIERAIVDDVGGEEPFAGSLTTLVARG